MSASKFMNPKHPTDDDALPLGTYAFDAFRFDARRLRLTRHGDDVALTPKALAVLEYLVRRPGRVVSKQALLGAAWPTVVVEEGNLSQTIYLLRRALGEQPADHRCIVTVPGRGYRFVAEVSALEDVPVAEAASTHAAEPPSVARGARDATDAPAASDADDAGVSQDQAVPFARRTLRRPRWTTGGTRIALASLVVACGLLYLGNQPRPAERPMIATSTPGASRPVAAPPAVEPGRHVERDATLARARFLFGRRAPGDLQSALAVYRELIARDPNDAVAWTGVAGVLFILASSRDVGAERNSDREAVALRQAARRAAERAIAIDPTLAEAHMRLAMLQACAGEERGALESRAAALRFGPDVPLVLQASAEDAAVRGDFAAAVHYARRSVERDPLNVGARTNLSEYLIAAHRLDEAEAESTRAFELAPNDETALTIGAIRLARGNVDGATRMFATLRDEALRERGRALLTVVSDPGARAEAALQRLAARVARNDPYVLAEAYALHGDRDRAFEWLERAAPSDGGRGVAPKTRPRWTMPSSPLLAQLHADPRWYDWERAATRIEQ